MTFFCLFSLLHDLVVRFHMFRRERAFADPQQVEAEKRNISISIIFLSAKIKHAITFMRMSRTTCP